MRCPECGSEVAENATLCPACGATLTATSGAAKAGVVTRHLEGFLFFGGIAVLALGCLAILQSVSHAPFGHWALPSIEALPLDHANPFIRLVLLIIVVPIIVSILTAQRGRLPFIRRIAGLNAIDEAVGRATEMGRPILFSTGLAGISIVTLQALAVAAHVGRTAVRYGTRLILPICDQTMMPITEETMREVYTAEGHPEAFRAEDVRFLSDRQFAYAAGVTGILHRERVAASFLFGQFFAEALILAENGQAVGAIQVAGTPDLTQIPFFVVTCDYTIIGDEYYAATAYLSREPTQLGSLVGQDISKGVLFVIILIGIVWSIFAQDPHFNPFQQWFGGS